MQQRGALLDDGSCDAGFAWVRGVVEGAGVEPGAIYGASEAIAFAAAEEAAGFEVVLPFPVHSPNGGVSVS